MVPIALFVYNRVDKAQSVYDSLKKNEEAIESVLYVFSDGAKNSQDQYKVDRVRKEVGSWSKLKDFKKIIEIRQTVNIGLANSIIGGINYILNEHESVIVVEDDLIVSKYFLKYMNEALGYYAEDNTIGSVAAFIPNLQGVKRLKQDVFLMRKGDCWGWGTWRDRWEGVDWDICDYSDYRKSIRRRMNFEAMQTGLDDMLKQQMEGKIDSWAVRWIYHLEQQKKLTVYPMVSLCNNVGCDGTGVHCDENVAWMSEISERPIKVERGLRDKRLERENSQYSCTFSQRIKYKVNIVWDYFYSIYIGVVKKQDRGA